ncbi:MAG: hypothetical protein JWO06_3807, partial [Bacteroidota bacterium]|nr:hypothetical protein [Bacteroidota bacterium]
PSESETNGGEKKEFVKKEYVKKEFVKKDFVKKDFTKTEGGTSESKPARKRENKMTDYLEDKKPAADKAPKKKSDSSVVDEFMKKFDDDLSW